MSNLKCHVCGAEFPAVGVCHYISRDETKIGIAAAIASNDEPTLYDTYDCPDCGSQVIAQPRKRRWVEYVAEADEETEEEESAKNNEEIIEAVGYDAIAAYPGLSEKQMATIRQAKAQHTGLVILKGTVQ